MVGSSRETVSRTIGALAAQHLIEASQGGIRILNREALETAAGQLLRRRLKTPPADGVDDAPAIWLFEPVAMAGVHKRLRVGPLRADAWWSGLPAWSFAPGERRP